MQETEHYKLKKPSAEDFYNIADQNGNMDKVDTTLQELDVGKADLDPMTGKVREDQLPEMAYIKTSQKGTAGGVASLGGDGKVPAAQLPEIQTDQIVRQPSEPVNGSTLLWIDTDDDAEGADLDELLAGKADLDPETRKIVPEQLPSMPYDSKGSAEAVALALDEHAGDVVAHVTQADRDTWDSKADHGQLFDAINAGWQLLWSRETAGSGTWVAPDLNQGRSYVIGVFVIGGGAAGDYVSTSSSGTAHFKIGGTSGRTTCRIITVVPGNVYNFVVGTGGTQGARQGGASAFNGIAANGGLNVGASSVSWPSIEMFINTGAQAPVHPLYNAINLNPFGGALCPNTYLNGGSSPSDFVCVGYPNECVNPFTGERILGAGASYSKGSSSNSLGTVTKGGKNPLTGLGGGDLNENATAPGCGGGAIYASNDVGGNGAAGAIYLYTMGV